MAPEDDDLTYERVVPMRTRRAVLAALILMAVGRPAALSARLTPETEPAYRCICEPRDANAVRRRAGLSPGRRDDPIPPQQGWLVSGRA